MPAPFVPCATAVAADWIVEGIYPRLGRVASIVPMGFETYLRILFPFTGWGDSPVPWRQVAAHAGRELSASTASDELWDSIPAARQRQLGIYPPLSGNTPGPIAQVLADILTGHTTTPEECYFAVWEGRGGLDPYRGFGASFRTPARRWFLYSATVADAVQGFEMTVGESTIPPNIWWPADHRWYVAAELDSCCVYLGCTNDAAHELLATDLEAFLVDPDDPQIA
jgi:hypothetical protein